MGLIMLASIAGALYFMTQSSASGNAPPGAPPPGTPPNVPPGAPPNPVPPSGAFQTATIELVVRGFAGYSLGICAAMSRAAGIETIARMCESSYQDNRITQISRPTFNFWKWLGVWTFRHGDVNHTHSFVRFTVKFLVGENPVTIFKRSNLYRDLENGSEILCSHNVAWVKKVGNMVLAPDEEPTGGATLPGGAHRNVPPENVNTQTDEKGNSGLDIKEILRIILFFLPDVITGNLSSVVSVEEIQR